MVSPGKTTLEPNSSIEYNSEKDLKLRGSEEYYAGPVEIEIETSDFEKILSGEVRNGWLEIKNEK